MMTFLSRRSVLSTASVTALTGLLGACGSGTAARKASAASGAAGDLVIGLTYTPNVQFAPFYLALKNGRYAPRVSLRHHGEQEGQFDALLAGTEQIVVAGADEAVVAASNGGGLSVIGGFYQRYPGCIIVPEDSDITDLADLKGRSIGTPGKTGETWYSLLVALSTAGLGQDEVTIQEIGYTQQAALASGKVDAVSGYANNDAVQLAQNGTPVRTLCALWPSVRTPRCWAPPWSPRPMFWRPVATRSPRLSRTRSRVWRPLSMTPTPPSKPLGST